MKIKIKHPYTLYPIPYTLYLSFCLLSFVFIAGCSDSPTENGNTITVSGIVTLEGRSDHSGVKVSLYKPVELDTALVRINQQYPNIGVQISQETEFDHREHEPGYITTSISDGSWKIENVGFNEYNIVVEHEEYGWHYLFGKKGETPNITLKKKINLNGNNSSLTLFENEFVEVNGSSVIIIPGNVTFRGTNYLLFNGDFELKIISGAINFDNASLKIFKEISSNFPKLTFDCDDQINLENIICHDNAWVNVEGETVKIEKSIFSNTSSRALSVSKTSTIINNTIFKNSSTGCILNGCQDASLAENIFIDNNISVDIFNNSKLLIQKNYYGKSEFDIKLILADGSVSNNHFEQSGQNINIGEKSNLNVDYNNFHYSKTNIKLIWISYTGNVVELSATKNNFLSTEDWIFNIPGKTAKSNILATNNYWGTTSTPEIQLKIYDVNDRPGESDPGEVIYEPFLFVLVDSAGLF